MTVTKIDIIGFTCVALILASTVAACVPEQSSQPGYVGKAPAMHAKTTAGRPVAVAEIPDISERFVVIYQGSIDDGSTAVIRDKETKCEYIIKYSGGISGNISPNCSFRN